MQICKSLVLAATGLALGASGLASAANYQEYKQKLKSGEITPLGSKRAGNEEGTIPEWNCGKDGVPPHIDVDPANFEDRYTYPAMDEFPFQDEAPRFVITADNYKQHKDKLTPGTIKLLKQYPDEFRVPVYPTHRTSCWPQSVYKQTKLNAKNGKLVNNGTGTEGLKEGIPFPLPENGLQANWNNLAPPLLWYEKANYVSIAVFPDRREIAENDTMNRNFYNDPTISREEYWSWDKQVFSPYINHTIRPERNRGSASLGWGYMRKKQNPRITWQYLPGTRRVRRYPYYGFDTPQGAGGLRGIDEDRLWNGSTERFNVELLGTKEMIVPYNAYGYDMADSYSTITGNHVVNPKVTRWEVHRVRVIEATLKEGSQHWYQRRVLYQDLDKGNYLLADNYDHQGNLWRTSQQNFVWTPLAGPGMTARAGVFYDFQANAYSVQRLFNEVPRKNYPVFNKKHLPRDWFGPGRLRQMSVR